MSFHRFDLANQSYDTVWLETYTRRLGLGALRFSAFQ